MKDSEFVKWHAKQGFVLCGLTIVVSLLSIPLSFIGIGFVTGCLVPVAAMILSVMGIVKGLAGQRWRMPRLADLADKMNL